MLRNGSISEGEFSKRMAVLRANREHAERLLWDVKNEFIDYLKSEFGIEVSLNLLDQLAERYFVESS